MSNVIRSDEELNSLHSYLEYLRMHGVNKEFIASFLDEFILKNENGKPLSSYEIDLEKNFIPYYNMFTDIVKISYEGFLETMAYYIKYFLTLDSSLNVSDDLYNYVALFILIHELEHGYQNYIRKNLIDSPSIMLASCYKLHFKNKASLPLLDRAKIIWGEFFYNLNRGHLDLERNANVETMNILYKLASLEEEKNLIALLNGLRKSQAIFGYEFRGDGVLVRTAKVMLQSKELYGFEEVDTFTFEEKVRYGLPLNREERQRLIQSTLKYPNNKFVKFLFKA